MTISKFFAPAFSLAVFAFCLSACKESLEGDNEGQMNLEITDGPTDDADVKSVFVTVAAVKVDGQDFPGFSKKTIDLMAYQHGDVAVLGLSDMKALNYQNVTLVLDVDRDASGNTPGSYVQTKDNVKHRLSANAEEEVTVAKNFNVEKGERTNLVVDFDLRKAVRYQSGGGSDHYDFVSSNDLKSSLRVVLKGNTGTIKGKATNNIVASDRLVVYAYKKGQFNRSTEVASQEGVAFKNAVTSSAVDNNGNYHLSFLEEGTYELQFASYKDTNGDGKGELIGTLLLDSILNTGTVTVGANAQVQIDVVIIGLLPI